MVLTKKYFKIKPTISIMTKKLFLLGRLSTLAAPHVKRFFYDFYDFVSFLFNISFLNFASFMPNKGRGGGRQGRDSKIVTRNSTKNFRNPDSNDPYPSSDTDRNP